jgi:hypothetical protein
VNADHKKVARSDARRQSFAVRTVKSAELANDVVVADLEIARFAFELNVLRLTADYDMLKNPIPGADSGEPFDYSIGPNLAIWANFRVIFYDGRWVDGHFLTGFTRFTGFTR